MNLKKTIPYFFMGAALILTIICLIVLPDTVIIQVSSMGSEPSTASKPIAILIPSVITILGALSLLFNKGKKEKGVIVSIVGVIMYIIMLIINLQ